MALPEYNLGPRHEDRPLAVLNVTPEQEDEIIDENWLSILLYILKKSSYRIDNEDIMEFRVLRRGELEITFSVRLKLHNGLMFRMNRDGTSDRFVITARVEVGGFEPCRVK